MIEQTETRESITGVRKLIAANLVKSHTEIPAVNIIEECDLTGVDRAMLVPMVLASIGEVVRSFPVFNAAVIDGEIVRYSRCDIGIAVDTERGLMVPAVRDCGSREVEALADDVVSLAAKAREGKLSPLDMRAATTTFTSPGKRGGIIATPIINAPQTAIVGLHRMVDKPVVRDNQIVIRTIANLTLTFDHRVADGALAGDYLLTLARTLEAHALKYQASR
ncbi:2-oxo acid dehydrogenase subunit E2 [Leucobacter sp. UCMA 4100]|uniref:2-oxo acid dehydrogenase subunit E2 n=1 Tax=Leucobacter sp. UCMA 4100 TaxID=2810534 RepID=UPI0022EAA26F|nr:2-oxo acid dehydrogenase subunit E2 [Leucobacter sp. UCMA 4100]MDA3146275.1 2-oxo acid dehydrogenase subunit E2 [Leucobacter sp. UCMA 4100]